MDKLTVREAAVHYARVHKAKRGTAWLDDSIDYDEWYEYYYGRAALLNDKN